MKTTRLWIFIGLVLVTLATFWAATITLAKPPAQGPEEDEGPPVESVYPIEDELGVLDDIGIAANVQFSVPIQGRLTDSSGTAITGTKSITYALYETDTGGSPICYDNDPVTFNNGLFNGLLNGLNGCVSSDINGRQLYLGITVENDAEMQNGSGKRESINPIPYAYSLVPGGNVEGEVTGGDKATLFIRNTHVGTATKTYGLYARSDSDTGQAIRAYNSGKGQGLVARSLEGNPIEAYGDISTDRVFYVTNDGRVYADEGYNCGNHITETVTIISSTLTISAVTESDLNAGPCLRDNRKADFAEMLPATGEPEPGDVLVIDSDGELTPSTIPYQPTIVGVHSTRPSYLGNSANWGREGYVPLAMVGIVPVKASVENGNIQPGDLLVASSTPGHAMRADSDPPTGTVIGKALERLDTETGFIQMLVMLQ